MCDFAKARSFVQTNAGIVRQRDPADDRVKVAATDLIEQPLVKHCADAAAMGPVFNIHGHFDRVKICEPRPEPPAISIANDQTIALAYKERITRRPTLLHSRQHLCRAHGLSLERSVRVL